MKFGLLYIPDYYPERYPSASHYYGEMLEQIQYEEQLGFEGVFVAEHSLGGYAFPSPAVFAAAVSQWTQRMDVTALPKPVQRPYPPIWAACMVTPGSFTWAGQKGFHLMVPPFAYPEHAELQAKLALYWEALKAAGHDPRIREVLGVYHLYVADTDAEGHAVAKEHFFRYFDFFAGLDQRAAWQAADYQRYQGGELDAGDGIIFGSPERCV